MFCLKIINTFFEKLLYAPLKQIVQETEKTKQNKTKQKMALKF